MRAVADAGPLIHLSWIDRLDLLGDLFEEVLIPGAVEREVLGAPPIVPSVDSLRAALATRLVNVVQVTEASAVAQLRATTGLDPGESEAIVLVQEVGADLLLIDERKGRAYAERVGLPIVGTIGILQRARELGLISAATPFLDQLRLRGFWVSDELSERVRREESH